MSEKLCLVNNREKNIGYITIINIKLQLLVKYFLI